MILFVAVYLAVALCFSWPQLSGWQHLYFEVAIPLLTLVYLLLHLDARRHGDG